MHIPPGLEPEFPHLQAPEDLVVVQHEYYVILCHCSKAALLDDGVGYEPNRLAKRLNRLY